MATYDFYAFGIIERSDSSSIRKSNYSRKPTNNHRQSYGGRKPVHNGGYTKSNVHHQPYKHIISRSHAYDIRAWKKTLREINEYKLSPAQRAYVLEWGDDKAIEALNKADTARTEGNDTRAAAYDLYIDSLIKESGKEFTDEETIVAIDESRKIIRTSGGFIESGTKKRNCYGR
jgi:hypothetical protein